MILKSKFKLAFTLVELMVVIIIIGILAAIAVPSYQKYAINSKMAEGTVVMGVIAQSEIKYFQEHSEFVFADHSGDHGKNPPSLDPTATFETSARWETLGYPITLGSHSHFGYMVVSGKYDSSGTFVNVSSTTGNNFGSLATGRVMFAGYVTPDVDCGAAPNAQIGTTLGLSGSADYNYSIIVAIGDLNGDRGVDCTGLVRIIEAMPSTNNQPSSRGTIVFKAGN
jgi:prepilin-type N-terminal cleavage/methylation domain-containing protein